MNFQLKQIWTVQALSDTLDTMAEKKPPNIREIARVAGVSKSTVSAALRHHPDIAKATRQRIQAVAEDLGYRKDDRVAELMGYLSQRKRKPSPTPLIWLNDEEEKDAWQRFPWYRDVYAGALERAEQLGYKLDQLWCRQDGMRPERIEQILKARGIRGTLLIRPNKKSQLSKLSMDSIACAQVLCDPWDQRHHAAVPDGFHNMHLALRHVRALGYTRPGLIEQDTIRFDTHGAYRAAYLAAVEQEPVFSASLPPLVYKWGHPSAEKEVRAWMKRHRPDVLICHDNHVIRYLENGGFRVPEDVAVVHLNLADDVAGWSGIAPHHRELGAASVDLVVSQIQSNETSSAVSPYTIMVKGSWIPGTTAPPR